MEHCANCGEKDPFYFEWATKKIGLIKEIQKLAVWFILALSLYIGYTYSWWWLLLILLLGFVIIVGMSLFRDNYAHKMIRSSSILYYDELYDEDKNDELEVWASYISAIMGIDLDD